MLNTARFIRDSDFGQIATAPFRRTTSGRILFVLGIGRSGTHFLTTCLTSHPLITDLMNGKENPLIFPLIRDAAAQPPQQSRLLRKARSRYSWMSKAAHPKWLVDQSHPNIWFAERWSSAFPEARFVGILRNPYSVAASSFKLRSVRRWVEQWQDLPQPNPFLGSTAQNLLEYARMSLAERMALRWVSHYQQMQHLRSQLGTRLTVLRYEELCNDPFRNLSKVAELLKLPSTFAMPFVDHSALRKAESLSAEDVNGIRRVLNAHDVPDEWLNPL